MKADHFLQLLRQSTDSSDMESAFVALDTLARPAFDADESGTHYDWVLVRRKGVELGFVDRTYLDAEPRFRWGDEDNLVLSQLTFYNEGVRPQVVGFGGQLPFGLAFQDDRVAVRAKLAARKFDLRSYRTDCWSCHDYSLVISYLSRDRGIETVHVKLPLAPWPEDERLEPHLTVPDWLMLFGAAQDGSSLATALAPLDLPDGVQRGDDAREVDFTLECGLELYFEAASKMKSVKPDGVSGTSLVLGAVKFFRARDREARAWHGELPFGLQFDDSPDTMLVKIPHPPVEQHDGNLTGFALWHFPEASIHVLYSTIENHLFRVTLMAPGYWTEMQRVA